MSIETLAAGNPNAVGGPGQVATLVLPHPVVLAMTSGLLLWMSFPPAEWSWSAWIALVPLFLLIPSRRSPASLYLAAWAGGFAFWLGAVHWIWWTDETAWLGWVLMALLLSAWWPAFLFLARFARRRLALPVMVAAPIFWVALEYTRAFVLTGFPWYYLAHSQYRQVYFTQIADFAGSLGLSVLIALVNAYFVEALTLPLFRARGGRSWLARLTVAQRVRLAVVAVGVAGTLGYGAFRVSTARFRPGPRVAMLQSGEIQEHNSDKKKSSEALRLLYDRLARRAARLDPKPDLIVWPETSYPYRFVTIDPKLDPKAFDLQAKEVDPESVGAQWTTHRKWVMADIQLLLDEIRVPMMVGASTLDFAAPGASRYNSAVLFGLKKEIQSYHKLHLVPFGEYVPLLDAFPWLIRLTPYRGARTRFLDFGARPSWFDLGPHRLAAAICFEDTLPHVVRRFFSEAPDGRQPDLLVNLSNDGWFHQTSEHEMHLAVSTFRCVENRVPLARAVNTGISAMIDGNGRIVREMSKADVGVLTEVAPLDDRTSFYSRWGDWLGQSCLASTLGLLVLGTFAPRPPRNRAG